MAKTSTSAKKQDQTPLISDNTKLELTIPAATTKRAYNQALQAAAKTTKTKGFRAGKVPLNKVEELVGQDKLINAALDQVLPAAYAKLMEKEGKKPLTRPQIQIVSAEKDKEWKLDIFIAEQPEIKLGKYQSTISKAKKQAEKDIAEQEKKLKEDTDAPASELTDQQKREIRLQNIFRELATSIQPQIPELLIKEDVQEQLHRLSHQLEPMKLTLEDYLQRRGMSFEQLTQEMAVQSLSTYQVEFILQAIGEAENIKPSDKDLEEYLKGIDSKKKLSELDEQTKVYLRGTVERQQIIDHVLSL